MSRRKPMPFGWHRESDRDPEKMTKIHSHRHNIKKSIMRKITYFCASMHGLVLSIACQANAAIEREILLRAEIPPVIEVTSQKGALQKDYQLEFGRDGFLRLVIPLAISWNMQNTHISVRLNSRAELINKDDQGEKIEVKVSIDGKPLSDTLSVRLSDRSTNGAMPTSASNMSLQSLRRSEHYRAGNYAGAVSIHFSAESALP